MTRSFVIGNGKSRIGISLADLRKHGSIYGCNALYREFTPHYLIAVDLAMLDEIQQNKYNLTHEVWTNATPQTLKYSGFKFINPSNGWASGPVAMQLASTHAPSEIYMLGFDFSGDAGLVNNVYADTQNYKNSTEQEIFCGHWEAQVEQIVKSNPHIVYYRIVRDNYYRLGWKYTNFIELAYESFCKLKSAW